MPDEIARENGMSAAAAQLAERERAHFALAERAARVGYWRLYLATNISYCSPGMYRLLDIGPDEQMPDGYWLLEQMLPEDKLNVQEAIGTAIRTRSSFSYRTHARDPNVAAQIVDTQGEVAI